MSYIGTEPKDIRSFGRTKFDYTATQGQTAFTGADDDGKVLAFTVGQIEVYVNGILMDDSDFTTTGTGTVTLASAANLNDVINIVSFESNIPDNDYVPASGGTFTGNVTHSGTVAHTGDVTITGNANDANGNLKVTTNTPANYPAMVIETSTGGNSTEVHGLHIKNTAAGYGLRIDDESSDTTPFVVASDGKVGIGEAEPSEGLEVKGSTTDNIAVKYSGTSGGHNSGYLFKDFRGQINAGIKNNLQDDGVGSAASHLGLYTSTSGTLTKQMEITRYGYVTKPNQPSFNAYRNTSLTTNTGSTWTLVPDWTGTRFNNSNSFNTSNGRFTAPVAGEYLFGVTNNMGSSHTVKSWRLYVNGSAWIVISYADVTASWQNLSAFALVTLNASDYIQFAYRGQPDYGNDWLNVYGYLMG